MAGGKTLGQARLHGWPEYKRTITDNTIVLTADDGGTLAVSGYDHRPIIDMSGEAIASAFSGHAKVNATFADNVIVITGGEA